MVTWQEIPVAGDWPAEAIDGVRLEAQGQATLEGDAVAHCRYTALVWKDPAIRPAASPTSPGPDLVAMRGPGRLAFSGDAEDCVVPLVLAGGSSMVLRHDAMVLATAGLRPVAVADQPPISSPGLAAFEAVGETLVVLQAAGSAFGATLEADDSIDVRQGALLYADPGIELELVSQPLGTETHELTMIRCGGPGRIGIQTLIAP